MIPLWTIIVKEIRLLARDPGSLLLLFILPAIFIFILSIALQGVFSTESIEKMDIIIVNDDEGDVGEDIVEGLKKQGDFRVVTEIEGQRVTLETAKAGLTRGDFDIAVHIPPNATEAANFNEESSIDLYLDPALANDFAARLKSEMHGFACLTTLDRTGARVKDVKDSIDKLKEANDKLRRAVDKLKEANEELQDANDEIIEANETLIKANDKLLQVVGKMKKALKKVKQLQELAMSEGMEIPKGFDITGEADLEPPEKQIKLPGKIEKPRKAETAIQVEEIDLPDEVEAVEVDIETGEMKLGISQKYYAAGEVKTIPTSVQQIVPGWTLFALFWISQILSLHLLTERQTGAYRRLLVSPIGQTRFFAGKVIPYFLINMIQAAAMFSIGIYILPLLGTPALQINNFGAFALLTIVFSLVSIGFGFFVAAFSKTLFFAAVMTATLMVVMAVIGGVMVPTFVMPRFMQIASYFVPHGWALEGYLDILVRNYGIREILPHTGMLLLFGALFYILAMIRYRTVNQEE